MPSINITREDLTLKKNVVRLAREIRSKTKAILMGDQESQHIFEKVHRPLIEPIRNILTEVKGERQPTKSLKHDVEERDVSAEKRIIKKETDASTREATTLQRPPFHQHNESIYSTDDKVAVTADDDDVFSPNVVTHHISAPAYQEYLDSYHPLTAEYIDKYYRNTDEEPRDVENGVQLDTDTEKFSLGDKEIRFLDNGDFSINSNIFKGTRGLYELLFMKNPSSTYIKKDDVVAYKRITSLVNLFKLNKRRASESSFASPSGAQTLILPEKYMLYVKASSRSKSRSKTAGSSSSRTMTLRSKSQPAKKSGGKITKLSAFGNYGGNLLKTFSKREKDYVFFDDYNEIVERLKKLVAAQMAGNTSVNNEIISIIEELREANIIE